MVQIRTILSEVQKMRKERCIQKQLIRFRFPTNQIRKHIIETMSLLIIHLVY
jgi:hypothetical protein